MSLTLVSLIIYMVILGIIVYINCRKKKESEFLIASRRLDWKANGLSLFATMISSYNIILIITLSYIYGFYIMLILVGLVLSLVFLYIIYNKDVRKNAERHNYVTIMDYFKDKFGKNVNFLINLIVIFFLVFFITLQIKVSSILFSGLFSIGLFTSALLIAGVVLVYSLIGGFKAEAYTDVFQGILMLVFLVLAGMIVSGASLESGLVLNNLKNTSLFFDGIALIVLQFLVLIVQPELWQRIIASKNTKEFRKSVILSSVLLMVFFLSLAIIGFYARHKFLIEDPGNAIFDILQFAAPSWFLPIVIISVLAAFMSTIDSSLFALASQLAKSFGRKSLKWKTQLFMIIAMIVLVPVSLYSGDFLTMVFQLVSILIVVSVVYLFKLVIDLSDIEAFIGLVIGVIFYVYAVFSGLITQQVHTSLYTPLFVLVFLGLQRIMIRIFNWKHSS